MITLVGVGHVFDIGARVRDVVLARRPKVVALELDPLRYSALLSRRREARGVSLLHLLASLESKIAREYGVQVGDEMLAAAQAAREAGSELALIDRDARDVLVRTWRAMSFGERVRFLAGIVRSAFVGRDRVEAELERYHADERAVIDEFTAELPTAKRILIDERDEHMAARIREIHAAKGDVLAIVGDGHVSGLSARLQGEPVDIVRLRDLRREPPPSGASVSVTVDL